MGRSGGRGHGGITPVLLSLIGAFCDRSFAVEVISIADGRLRELIPDLDPRAGVYELGPGGRRDQLLRLKEYLQIRRPRALLAAGHRSNLLAIAAARSSTGNVLAEGIRLVLSVHNALSPGLRQLDPLRRWLRLRAIRRSYPLADAVICVSAGVADDFVSRVPFPRDRLNVIHNPIAAAGDLSAADGPKDCHPWLAPGQPPVILAAGRLTRQKAFDNLVRAFARLDCQPLPRLLILGEGNERAALEHQAVQLGIADRVSLAGFVRNPRLHMAHAALFVLSSEWEGFGNVLVEAMSVGTPVVATDCPSGPREILKDGALGPLVPPGDPDALAAAMRQMLEMPQPPAWELKARAQDFAPACIASRYLGVLLPGSAH